VGDLGAGGHVLVVLVEDLVAVEVGPARGEAAGLAVGFDRGVDGVAAGERVDRGGDAVVGADGVAERQGGDAGGGGHHRRGRGGGRLGGGGRRHHRIGLFAAAASKGGGADGGQQQGMGETDLAHGSV